MHCEYVRTGGAAKKDIFKYLGSILHNKGNVDEDVSHMIERDGYSGVVQLGCCGIIKSRPSWRGKSIGW